MIMPDKIFAGLSVLGSRIFHRRIPLLVGWALTNRCNQRCLYCDIKTLDDFEMPLKDIVRLIDEMVSLGTRFIQFTGGDAILRDDIDQILRCCYQKGIYTTLSCSGELVPEKVGELRYLGRIGLSLDGSQTVHDTLRGAGSFERVMNSAEVLRRNNIKFKFVTVLTIVNLKEIDFILGKAEEFGTHVLFQPSIEEKLYGVRANVVSPEARAYRQTIEAIILAKKNGARVANSLSALRHLLHWPSPHEIRCPGGRIMCCIRNNGQVAVCSRVADRNFSRNNCLEKGFKKAFFDLPKFGCAKCWASLHVEASKVLSFSPEAIVNASKIV